MSMTGPVASNGIIYSCSPSRSRRFLLLINERTFYVPHLRQTENRTKGRSRSRRRDASSSSGSGSGFLHPCHLYATEFRQTNMSGVAVFENGIQNSSHLDG